MFSRTTPFTAPILYFALTGLLGTFLLLLPVCQTGTSISVLDALFISISAVCVTGLATIDIGQNFSMTGQWVILALMQIGGLGIMTYSSLVLYLWKSRISLQDRDAVSQSLLHDPSFQIGSFLIHVVLATLATELVGAILLYFFAPDIFSPFAALFHAISAFTNGGLSLFSEGLVNIRGNIGVNVVLMVLIVLGGLGFAVLVELKSWGKARIFQRGQGKQFRLSFHTRTVLATTLFLILFGAGWFMVEEWTIWNRTLSNTDIVLASFFQSISARTAGLNTVDISTLSIQSSLVMMFLMFIGGSPGSCAGGIKTTTFRTIIGFAWSNIRGVDQTVIHKTAVDKKTLSSAFTLIIFAVGIVIVGVIALSITEASGDQLGRGRSEFLDIVFETVSAFGTAGLSSGLTGELTGIGKIIITILMFIGRLGPILFLSAIRDFHAERRYEWPEEGIMIG